LTTESISAESEVCQVQTNSLLVEAIGDISLIARTPVVYH